MTGNYITIDARYKSCPGPLITLVKSIRELKAGTTIRLLATDPDAPKDIKQWCARTGHKFLGFKREGEMLEIYVEVT